METKSIGKAYQSRRLNQPQKEQEQEPPKLISKTKLIKKTIIGQNQNQTELASNEIQNTSESISNVHKEKIKSNKKENKAEFLLKLIFKAYYLSTWKKKVKSMKYYSRAYNPRRINFKKLITEISSVLKQHKFDYFNEICENMDNLPMPSHIKHDVNYGKIRIVDKEFINKSDINKKNDINADKSEQNKKEEKIDIINSKPEQNIKIEKNNKENVNININNKENNDNLKPNIAININDKNKANSGYVKKNIKDSNKGKETIGYVKKEINQKYSNNYNIVKDNKYNYQPKINKEKQYMTEQYYNKYNIKNNTNNTNNKNINIQQKTNNYTKQYIDSNYYMNNNINASQGQDIYEEYNYPEEDNYYENDNYPQEEADYIDDQYGNNVSNQNAYGQNYIDYKEPNYNEEENYYQEPNYNEEEENYYEEPIYNGQEENYYQNPNYNEEDNYYQEVNYNEEEENYCQDPNYNEEEENYYEDEHINNRPNNYESYNDRYYYNNEDEGQDYENEDYDNTGYQNNNYNYKYNNNYNNYSNEEYDNYYMDENDDIGYIEEEEYYNEESEDKYENYNNRSKTQLKYVTNYRSNAVADDVYINPKINTMSKNTIYNYNKGINQSNSKYSFINNQRQAIKNKNNVSNRNNNSSNYPISGAYASKYKNYSIYVSKK